VPSSLALALIFPIVAQANMSLQKAVEIALQRNQDVHRVELQVRQAEADLALARSAILPHLDFNASATAYRVGAGATFIAGLPYDQQTAASGGAFALGVFLRQLLFDGGKWWNNLASASAGLDSTRQQANEQRLHIAFLVEQRYFELARAEEHLKVISGAASRSKEQAQVVEQLVRNGRVSQADVLAARANRDNDAINRRRQAAVAEQARLDLAQTMGLEPREPLVVGDAGQLLAEIPQPPSLEQAVSRALAERPAIKAAEAQLEAQNKLASALAGDYWPALSLNGTYTRDVPIASRFFDDPSLSSILSGSVVLTWNVFNGLGTKAQVDRARLQAAIFASDLAAARRNAAIEVEKALSGLLAAIESARLAAPSVQASAEVLQQARAGLMSGSGSQYEERDAELRLTQSQLVHVSALADARIAEAALRRAIGARRDQSR
jgi:outer membrane protein